MFWRKIILDGYLPFSHNNIKHVEIDFEQPATCIVAQNGVGKSSLLRQLTVFNPPTRTDFAKDGKIVKVLSHNGHIFTLTSDFKNATAPHSFKMDDQELNLSGTSDCQKDLSVEHFGINSVIEDIMSGNVHICSMQKSLRKQLFSATYPSDLSFVLEYHKKVCSQIRAYSNQIKLLQGREGSLMASLIGEAERCYMEDYREGYIEILNRIDKSNLLLESEISQLQQSPWMQSQVEDRSTETLCQAISHPAKHFQHLLTDWNQGRKLGEQPTAESLNERVITNTQTLKFLQEKTETLQTNLVTIRDELDKFIRVRDAPASDKKDELASELLVLEKKMNDLLGHPSWTNLPSINKHHMTLIENWVAEGLPKLIAALHPYVGKLIDNDGVNHLKTENDTLTFSVANLMAEKTTLEQQLAQLQSRKSMMTQNSYPKDCTRVCGLRATLEASVRDIDLQCKDLELHLKKIYTDIEENNARLTHNQRKLMEVAPALPIMKQLWDKLSEFYLVDVALNGETFLECINSHFADIPNRIIKGFESSQIYYLYEEYRARSEQIKSTLAMMKSSEAANLSAEVIQEMITERQKKLDAGIVELERLEQQLTSLKSDTQRARDAQTCLNDLQSWIKTAEQIVNRRLIQCRIEFDQKMIQEHLAMKNEIGTRLREIEHTLDEQKRITDVLNTEIRPTLEQLRKDRLDWELVESGLSPTKGLPCIYLVRFMNRLIARANAIIKEIWYSDMEIAYIEEKETLDFSLGVIFNKSSTIKDCSLCSNGQKAVLDFAFTVALATERGFQNWCPLALDEADAALTEQHRTAFVGVINRLLGEGIIKQLFLVNHFAMQTGMQSCDIVSLSSDGIVLPMVYNQHAVIE